MAPPVALASGFAAYSEADWRAAVAKIRRGEADVSPALLPPLFRRRPNARPLAGRAAARSWAVIQRIDARSAADAIAKLRMALNGGAGGAELAFVDALHPLGGSIPLNASAAIALALDALAPLNFALRIDSQAAVTLGAFAALGESHSVALSRAGDPAAGLALGVDMQPRQDHPRTAAATADGRIWHAAGASDAQELGIVLATLVQQIRQLDQVAHIDVTLVADSDQVATLAKFRAGRLAIERLAEVASVSPVPTIHAETAWRSMSRREPEINILRAASAAFGAATGGADSITVLPFDGLDGGSADGERLARNTAIIMAEEAGLCDVADPGAGSGAIETLSEQLAEAAWREFQQIEAAGGIIAAIGDGDVIRRIAAERDARLAAVVDGTRKMIGVNAYGPDSTAVRMNPRAGGADGLRFVRLAEAFE